MECVVQIFYIQQPVVRNIKLAAYYEKEEGAVQAFEQAFRKSREDSEEQNYCV